MKSQTLKRDAPVLFATIALLAPVASASLGSFLHSSSLPDRSASLAFAGTNLGGIFASPPSKSNFVARVPQHVLAGSFFGASLKPTAQPILVSEPRTAVSWLSPTRGRGSSGILSATMGMREKAERAERAGTGHKVLVLNSSYEPLSVVSASRALALIWANKALQVVAHSKKWTSCSGLEVDLPSVVCLRRYVKVRPKFPVVSRRTVLMRDNGICQYCGRLAENIDHVIPRCRGGQNVWQNVVASCAPCNNKKADKLLKDTDMKLKRPPQMPTPSSWVHAAVWKVDPRWKPYVGEVTWQDIEEMWQGTKMDRTQRKTAKAVAKKSGSTNSDKNKSKASPPASSQNAKTAPPAKTKTTATAQASQAEVENVVGAYTPQQKK